MSSTLKKLRYRSGMRVAVIGAPAGFEVELAASKGVERAQRLEQNLDLVQAFFTRRAHLEREAARLEKAIAPKGLLWICYPKAKALGTDLNRDVVRTTVAKWGLEAVAICAVNEVWSALRCKRAGGFDSRRRSIRSVPGPRGRMPPKPG